MLFRELTGMTLQRGSTNCMECRSLYFTPEHIPVNALTQEKVQYKRGSLDSNSAAFSPDLYLQCNPSSV